ncbi:MAG TPA: hypothetical protein VMH00_16920 [Candidatus Limnocylindrales bacterium]|nr:hypothetical protein [Candidatus Limnocylindrales bacterium]
MPEELDRQALIDTEHLKLLSLGYMIAGGVSALFSLIGLFYAFMGLVVGATIAHVPASGNNSPPPAFIGWIFGAIGLGIFFLLVVFAILKFRAAVCLRNRTSRVFCMVVAAISCLEFPYGTALGVLTFIVLGRDSVIRTFRRPGVSSPVA